MPLRARPPLRHKFTGLFVRQVRLKKRDALVTAAMHLRKKELPACAASLSNLIACFKVHPTACQLPAQAPACWFADAGLSRLLPAHGDTAPRTAALSST